MLLVIDIGNTNIVFGLFRADELIFDFRLATEPGRSVDEYSTLLLAQFAGHNLGCDAVQDIAIASVVPLIDKCLTETCNRLFMRAPLIVNAKTKTGLTLRYETPETLGADRIVAAVAAFERFQTAVIVIDMGTATTFDYVDHHGSYWGGAIAPGFKISAEALFQQAAKLPRIDFEYPERIIGRSTAESMQSGIVAGYIAMVEGMIDRIQTESGSKARVIATGGLARLIAGHTKKIDAVDDTLLLKGLKLIYERSAT